MFFKKIAQIKNTQTSPKVLLKCHQIKALQKLSIPIRCLFCLNGDLDAVKSVHIWRAPLGNILYWIFLRRWFIINNAKLTSTLNLFLNIAHSINVLSTPFEKRWNRMHLCDTFLRKTNGYPRPQRPKHATSHKFTEIDSVNIEVT